MTNLIERSAVERIIRNHMKECSSNYGKVLLTNLSICVGDAPAVDAVPVKHGHWIIRKFGDRAKCSICGMTFADAYDLENYDHYCRHCGSIMESIKMIENDNILNE